VLVDVWVKRQLHVWCFKRKEKKEEEGGRKEDRKQQTDRMRRTVVGFLFCSHPLVRPSCRVGTAFSYFLRERHLTSIILSLEREDVTVDKKRNQRIGLTKVQVRTKDSDLTLISSTSSYDIRKEGRNCS
jgi:hypothetical protein